ncbi:golgin subfamily A member 6-like protein 6 isoform X2 [Xyrauchen texanus]|uniref:golgin subfamily A member 6-like protein 6 isoform X2 n=1 Tax=Xyrauchen texanus TaxID=154827 RepID=UPI00224259F0|nr:golgin subfamily A member 6-like protein 6 isoform X2 [Xyrauchen texanus]
MSDNSNSANGNNQTPLTPEVKEPGVENVGPEVESTKIEGEPSSSTAPEPSTEGHIDLVQHSSEAAELQPQAKPSTQEPSDPAHTHASEHAKDNQPPELPQVTPPETSEDRAHLNAAHIDEDSTSISSTAEDLSSWTADQEELSALSGYSESPVSPRTDGDSFFDSFTHTNTISGSSTFPASVCQGGEEFKTEESHLRKTITEETKPDVEVLETKGKEGECLRKRNISHLGSLDHGKNDEEDDEEGDEEEFQPPQREEETVFSLNKCIIGAVVLLGLGAIFFSGDIDVGELKGPTNQEWLNPEVSRDTPVGLQPPDILSKQAKDDQQILVLQAQLQQHLVELKAAQLWAEEGEKERVKREELEKQCQKIKGELDRLPAFQKELEQENVRMKEESERAKGELEALPLLHRELDHLRRTVSQLTQSTGQAEPVHPVADSGMPSTGDSRDVLPKERQEIKIKTHWDKMRGEKEKSIGEKECQKKNCVKKEDEQMMEKKDWKEDKGNQEEGKAWKSKDEKEWKDKKQEDGKMQKETGKKKAFKEWEEKKEWKEDKKWMKDKHGEQNERRLDKKDWKETGNKEVKGEKEWKLRGEQKDWKNEKEAGRNGHKEKKKELKEKGEKESRKGKSKGKVNEKTEKIWRGEREFSKEYGGKKMEEKDWAQRGKEEWSKDGMWKREGIKEAKKNKAYYYKNEATNGHNEKEKQHKDEKEWNNKVRHRRGSTYETSKRHNRDHENYWAKQRKRIQHYHRQREPCSGVADCARAEGLSPVSLNDFEMLLQEYLAKLQDPEDQTSRKEELSEFVKEFFKNGVFAHDHMPFREFVEGVGNILEDLTEGEESELEDSDENDNEMEEFEKEAMEKFALPEEVGKVKKNGERKKLSGRVKEGR